MKRVLLYTILILPYGYYRYEVEEAIGGVAFIAASVLYGVAARFVVERTSK